MLNLVDLCSGIGGFSLAAGMTGRIQTVAFCEKDRFCQRVLRKHWPTVPIFPDIYGLTRSDVENNCIGEGLTHIVTAGFPCQPFSLAGNRMGAADNRYIWPEVIRVIREFKPTWVVCENVAGIVGMGLEVCISDLEAAGYEVQCLNIPACGVQAPHIRERVWIIAHSPRQQDRRLQSGGFQSDVRAGGKYPTAHYNGTRQLQPQGVFPDKWGRVGNGNEQTVTDSNGAGLQGYRQPGECTGERSFGPCAWEETWPCAVTRLCCVDARLPGGLVLSDRVSQLKSYGNAIVPEVAYRIFTAILKTYEE